MTVTTLLLFTFLSLLLACNVHAMRPAPFDEEYTHTAPSGLRLVSTNTVCEQGRRLRGGSYSTCGVSTVYGENGTVLYDMPVFTGRREIYLSPDGSVVVLDGNIYFGPGTMRPGDDVVTSVYLEGELWKEVRYETDLKGEPIDEGRVMGGGYARRRFTLDVNWERGVLTYDMMDGLDKREISLPSVNNTDAGMVLLDEE